MRQSERDLIQVREYLSSGHFAEAERLPPERELAENLRITRNRLRGALRKLATEGLIWRQVGKGTFLGPPPVPKEARVALPNVADMTNPREIMEARLVLEPELARLAATRASTPDIEEMQACWDRMKPIDDPVAFQTWDRHLHRLMAKATENTLMVAFLDTIQSSTDENIWGRLRDVYMTRERMEEAKEQHGAILRAIRTRNPKEAETQMRLHMRAVQKKIFGEE
jgi:DNA-binding FadR family transcriptional regulator